jgi:hypothetical protein
MIHRRMIYHLATSNNKHVEQRNSNRRSALLQVKEAGATTIIPRNTQYVPTIYTHTYTPTDLLPTNYVQYVLLIVSSTEELAA